MFDNLIGNTDPNLGNWLVDPAWNLVLIDHTRSFTTARHLVHKIGRIDRELWSRISALTEETLQAALGSWIDRTEVRAILTRRAKMQEEIDPSTGPRRTLAVEVSSVSTSRIPES
jgi:hypothetical protein